MPRNYGLETLTQTFQTEDKRRKLALRTAEKRSKFGFAGNITGMHDADSVIIEGLGGTRSGTPYGENRYYDAVEIAHKDRTTGKDKLEFFDYNVGGEDRRKQVFNTQNNYIAGLLGKSPELVTRQDFIDVGNMQQVQKLADLARSDGDKKWQAPFISGSKQTNLTGQNYFNESTGQYEDIPLNIPVNYDITGKAGNRDVVKLQNPNTMLGVTDESYYDPLQNTTYTGQVQRDVPSWLDKYRTGGDVDQNREKGRVENWIDAGQYGIGRTVAGIADAAVDASTRGVIEFRKGILGETEDEAVQHIVDSSSLFERDPETGDFIGLNDYKEAKEYGYDNTRVNEFMDKAGKAYKSGNKLDMLTTVIEGIYTAGPELFLESAGEMASAFSGATTVGLAARYANDMLADRQENLKDGETLSNVDRLIAIGVSGPLVMLNRLGADEMVGNTKVIRSLVDTVAKGKSKSAMANIVRSVGTAALTVSGKAGYEGLEEVAQEAMQKFVATYGEETAKEFFSDETGKELFQAFAGGFGAGGAISAAGMIVPSKSSISDTISKASSLSTKDSPANKEAYIPVVLSDKIKENIDSIDNFFNEEIIKNVRDGGTPNDALKDNISSFSISVVKELEDELAKLDRTTMSADDLATVDSVTDRIIRVKSYNNEFVADGNRPILRNMDLGRIVSGLEKNLDNLVKSNASNVDISNAEYEILVAKQIGGIRDKVDVSSSKITDQESIRLKFYGGTVDGQPRTGLLEWADIISDKANSKVVVERAKEMVLNFMESQNAKADALNTAHKEYIAANKGLGKNDREQVIEFQYGNGTKKYHGNSDRTFRQPILAENRLMMDVIKQSLSGSSSDTDVEAKAEVESEALDDVSDATWDAFVDTGKVSNAELNRIAKKISEGRQTSTKESQIYAENAKHIEEYLAKASLDSKNEKGEDNDTEAKDRVDAKEAVTDETTDQDRQEPQDGKKSDSEAVQEVDTKTKKSVKIGDDIIEFYSVAKDPSRPIAVSTSDGIKMQSGLTKDEIMKYITESEIVTNVKDSVRQVKKLTNEIFMDKYGVSFIDILNSMNIADIKKFILLHEKRHEDQASKRDTRKEFIQEYKQDPSKFELDANVYALRKLGLLPGTKVESGIDSEEQILLDEIHALETENAAKESALHELIEENYDAIESYKWIRQLYADAQAKFDIKDSQSNRDKVELIGSTIESIDDATDIIKSKKLKVKEIQDADTVGGKMLVDMDKFNLKNQSQARNPGQEVESVLENTTLSDHFRTTGISNNINSVNFESSTDNKDDNEALGVALMLENAISSLSGSGKIAKNTTSMDVLDNSMVGKTKTGFQSISRLIMGAVKKKNGKLGEFKVHKTARKAIAISSLDWLSNIASANAAINRSDKDVIKMLGLDSKSAVTSADREMISMIDGTTSDAANMIGSQSFGNIGIKAKKSDAKVNRDELSKHMKTEMGLIGLLAMEEAGLIVLNNKTRTAKDTGFIIGKQSLRVDLFGGKSSADDKISVSTYNITPKGMQLINNRLSTKVDTLNDLLSTERYSTGVYFDNASGKTDRKDIKNEGISGKVGTISAVQKDAIEKQESTKYIFNDKFMWVFDKMYDAKPEFVEKSFGVIKDLESVHVEERASVAGKNIAIRDSIKHMNDTRGKLKESKQDGMWAKWYVMTNGRFGIKSNTFNWQDKKLHRHSVQRKDRDISSGSEQEVMFKLGIAQAFDISIDKQTIKQSMIKLDNMLQEIDAILDRTTERGTVLSEAYMYVLDNGGSSEPELAMLGLAEYMFWKKHKERNDGSVFKSGMTLETDDITSGYILKILQMPIFKNENGNIDMDKVFAELERGGIFKHKGNSNITYGKWRTTKGNLDAYEVPAKVFKEKVVKLKDVKDEDPRLNAFDTKIEGKKAIGSGIDNAIMLLGEKMVDDVLEISRSFMKNPFMVFNYGSAIRSILESQKRHAQANIYSLMTTIGSGTKKESDEARKLLVGVIKSAYELSSNKSIKKYGLGVAQRIENLSNSEMLQEKIPDNVMKSIAFHIGSVISRPLKETFDEQYSEFSKSTSTINSMFAMLFKAAIPKLNKALDAKLVEKKGKSASVAPLTNREIDDVIHSMRNVLPVFKIALGDKDSLGLIAKEEKGIYDTTVKSNMDNKAKVRGQGHEYFSAMSASYRLIESYSSGAVIPIHFMDGARQSSVLSEFEGIGVHDANIFDVDNAVSGTKAANQAVYDIANGYSLTTEMMESMINTMNSMSKSELSALDKDYIGSSIENNLNIAITDMIQTSILSGSEVADLRKQIGKYITIYTNALLDGKADAMHRIEQKYKLAVKATYSVETDSLLASIFDIKNIDSVSSIYKDMETLHIDSENGRYQLFNNRELYVEHAALEGAGIVTKPIEYIRKEPQSLLSDVASEYLKIEKKEETKVADAIIQDNKELADIASQSVDQVVEEKNKKCKKG